MKSIRNIQNQVSHLLKRADGERRKYICKCAHIYSMRIATYLDIDMGWQEAETKYTHDELDSKFEKQMPREIYAGYLYRIAENP